MLTSGPPANHITSNWFIQIQNIHGCVFYLLRNFQRVSHVHIPKLPALLRVNLTIKRGLQNHSIHSIQCNLTQIRWLNCTISKDVQNKIQAFNCILPSQQEIEKTWQIFKEIGSEIFFMAALTCKKKNSARKPASWSGVKLVTKECGCPTLVLKNHCPDMM